MTTPAQQRRAKQLAAIHVMARKQLRMDEATYRSMLERVSHQTGKAVRSAAELDARGRAAVLDELRRLKGEGQRHARQAVPPPGGPENVREELAAMVAKVGAILTDTGRSWAYANGLAKRMFKVQRVEWLTAEQLHRVVAALSYDQQRRRT